MSEDACGASPEVPAGLIEAAGRAPPARLPAHSPAEALLAPFLSVAEAWLEQVLAGAGPVGPSARLDLLRLLSARLTRLCMQLFLLERRALEASSRAFGVKTELDGSWSTWRERLEQYPLLADLLTGVYTRWQGYVSELMERLEQDRWLLADALFGGGPLATLLGVEGDAGDLHDSGRAVAILRFENERRVLYKPKDLRITRALQELLRWVNGLGPSLSLRVRAVLPRGQYTWEEFVEAEPCRAAPEVSRFYRRVGMHLRLFQLLEARDLTLDNLLAAGEQPVFFDTEALLQPGRSVAAEQAEVEAWLDESVVRTGVLSAPFYLAPGQRAEDVGALTPARELRTGIPDRPEHAALDGAPRRSRDGSVLWAAFRHAPSLEGSGPVDAGDHLPELLEGYREMHALLCANREALLAPDSPLEAFAGLPARYIHRATASYLYVSWASLGPGLLSDPLRRRAACEHLLGSGREDGVAQAIAQEESTSVLALDVPYFRYQTDGDALLGRDGEVLSTGFFMGTGMERARRRVRELKTFPLSRHEELLRSAFAANRAPREEAEEEPADATAPAAPDWLAPAVEIGEQLLADGISEGEGLAWIGMTYDPFHDCERVARLAPDLLSGTNGIAILLAELYAVTGQVRFCTGALRALAGTARDVKLTARELARGNALPPIGGFLGFGASLYTLARCAAALAQPDLLEEARVAVQELPLDALCARAAPDLVTGAGGLLLALSQLGSGARALAAFARLEERLRHSSTPLSSAYPSGARLLGRLPGPREGLELCAVRLGVRPAAPAPLPSEGSGALLAQLVLDNRLKPEWALRLAHRQGPVRLTRLERLEVALTAAERWREPALRAAAEMLAGRFLGSRKRHGHWLPFQLAAERHQLSVLWGLPALARAFLRLHAPGRFPSIHVLG